MQIFVSFTKEELKLLEKEYNSVPMLVIRKLLTISRTTPEEIVKLKKVKRGYAVPDEIKERIKSLAAAEGLPVSQYLLKHVFYPELNRLRSLGK